MSLCIEIDAVDAGEIEFDVWGDDHRIIIDNTIIHLTESQLEQMQSSLNKYLNIG